MSGIYIPGLAMLTTGLYLVSVDNSCGKDETVMTVKRMLGNRDVCQIIGAYNLVPVPEHGRLIDADALGIREAEKRAYEAYLREKAEFFTEEPLLEYMRGRLEGLTDASGRVRFAPTIIPESRGSEDE